MTHSVTGFITRSEFAGRICSEYSSLRTVSLEQGFSLFPLTDELLDSLHIPRSKGLEESSNLPNELMAFLSKLSTVGPLLYFETEYFGGEGSQLAVMFEDKKIVFGPSQNFIGPINDGLRLLGIQTKSNNDEFDSIGLGQHRFSQDWLR
jgi:hypothetical protein